MADLFENLLEQIRDFNETNAAVQEIGSGGRFLVCARETLVKNNGVVVMGENPGGSKESSRSEGAVAESPFLSKKNRSGEDWHSSMQDEMRSLLTKLSDQAEVPADEFIGRTLVSNFVFFRSSSIGEFKQDDVISFCRDVWKTIFLYNISNLRLLICSGKTAWDNMRELFDYFPDAESHSWEEIQLEYQDATRNIWIKSKSKFNDEKFLMCRIPNLTDRNVNALGGEIFNDPDGSFRGEIEKFLHITGEFL